MKVIELGPYSGPHGGVRTNLLAIRRALIDRGISCTTINLTRFTDAGGEDVEYPRNALEVVSLLLRRRCDVMHLHLGGMLTRRELALAAVCTLIPRCKTVLTFHSGGYPHCPQGQRAHPWTLRGAIFRRFDAVIAVNAALERLFKTFGVPPERIHLIPPYSVVPPPGTAELPRRLEHFFQQHSPVLLSVGQLEPEYDVPLQIGVLSRIRERFPNAGLMIVGDGSLREALARDIHESPCGQDILLCGDVEHAATLQAIRRADVLLRTTCYDGDSIAVREALHFGTPVIATDNGMRPAGVHAIAVSDAAALRASLETVLLQPVRRPPAAAADDIHIRAVLTLYRSLVSSQEDRTVARAGVSPRT